MEMKKLSEEQVKQLKADFPVDAISPCPKKPFLSTIKAYSIVCRLNEVFGVGSWSLKSDYIQTEKKTQLTKEGKERPMYEILAKATLDIPEYNIHLEQLGGGEDEVLGDAGKSAITDALNKCASYLYIGYSVFNGDVKPQQQPIKKANKFFDFKLIDQAQTVDELMSIYNEYVEPLEDGTKQKETAIDKLSKRKVYLTSGH